MSLVFTEAVIVLIISMTNLAEELGIGLILNFSAGMIVCEIDDIAMLTSTAQSLV